MKSEHVRKRRSKSLMRLSNVAFIIYEAKYLEWCGYDTDGGFIDFFHRCEVLKLKRNCGFTAFC